MMEGISRFVFFLSKTGKMVKWDAHKHPRDAKGRWKRVGNDNTYIFGSDDKLSLNPYDHRSGSPTEINLSPGDRVYQMNTGSHIVQHADGSGTYYISSRADQKKVLTPQGVQNMLQTKGMQPTLKKAVPGAIMQANSEHDAESAVFGTKSVEEVNPPRKSTNAPTKAGSIVERYHPASKDPVLIRVPEGSNVRQTSTGFVVRHADGSGTDYNAKTGYAREVASHRTATHSQKKKETLVPHPAAEGGEIAIRRAQIDKVYRLREGILVKDYDTGNAVFYPADGGKSKRVQKDNVDSFVKESGGEYKSYRKYEYSGESIASQDKKMAAQKAEAEAKRVAERDKRRAARDAETEKRRAEKQAAKDKAKADAAAQERKREAMGLPSEKEKAKGTESTRPIRDIHDVPELTPEEAAIQKKNREKRGYWISQEHPHAEHGTAFSDTPMARAVIRPSDTVHKVDGGLLVKHKDGSGSFFPANQPNPKGIKLSKVGTSNLIREHSITDGKKSKPLTTDEFREYKVGSKSKAKSAKQVAAEKKAAAERKGDYDGKPIPLVRKNIPQTKEEKAAFKENVKKYGQVIEVNHPQGSRDSHVKANKGKKVVRVIARPTDTTHKVRGGVVVKHKDGSGTFYKADVSGKGSNAGRTLNPYATDKMIKNEKFVSSGKSTPLTTSEVTSYQHGINSKPPRETKYGIKNVKTKGQGKLTPEEQHEQNIRVARANADKLAKKYSGKEPVILDAETRQRIIATFLAAGVKKINGVSIYEKFPPVRKKKGK